MPKQNADGSSAQSAIAACSPMPAPASSCGAAHAGSHASRRNDASAVAHAPSCAAATVQPARRASVAKRAAAAAPAVIPSRKLASITANA